MRYQAEKYIIIFVSCKHERSKFKMQNHPRETLCESKSCWFNSIIKSTLDGDHKDMLFAFRLDVSFFIVSIENKKFLGDRDMPLKSLSCFLASSSTHLFIDHTMLL